MIKKIQFSLIAVMATAFFSTAQDAAQPQQASSLLLPLIYETQSSAQPQQLQVPELAIDNRRPLTLDADQQWLDDATQESQRVNMLRYRAMIARPASVRYNVNTLPEPPKQYLITANPSQGMLTVEPPAVSQPTEAPAADAPLKIHNWLHLFNASLHFTQAYISGNWYQGGQNNLNILADIKWECNLNQNVHPNWLFNNSLQYKLGVTTAHGDSLRNYMINEDNFLFSSQLGYKAVKNWYYSAMLQFKTQFFNNYKSNTRTMTASFLSPGELNIGLGMTYEKKDRDGNRTFNLAIAPLSYNLKICRDITRLNPENFGIDEGHHTKHSFGSNIEAKLAWKLHPNISWTSRLYVFTNYRYVQGDWENTFDFSVTRYLNTQIYTHLRFDKSHPWDPDWRYWQFKEILSFGLTYRFSTT